jgi:hypothetical protein
LWEGEETTRVEHPELKQEKVGKIHHQVGKFDPATRNKGGISGNKYDIPGLSPDSCDIEKGNSGSRYGNTGNRNIYVMRF